MAQSSILISFLQDIFTLIFRTGTAQLLERPTKKPGAIRTRVRVPTAARDVSPRVNFRCRLSYAVRVQSHASTFARTLKITATPLSGHTEILHTLIGMGSAALAAAVPYQVRPPEFPARDKEVR